MKFRNTKFALAASTAAVLIGISNPPASAQGKKMAVGERPPLADVTLEQRLDNPIPLDAKFTDEDGKPVTLGKYFGKKPVILVMPFYKCAGSCALELDGMVDCFRKMQYSVGKDFNVVTVSINPTETPELAIAKKHDLLGIYMKDGNRPEANNGWHFLTGNWDSINQLATATGFHFLYDDSKATVNIAHPAGIMALTPQGKLSRYFYGTNYDPKSMRLALVEAGDNKVGGLVEKITLGCSSFDMSTGKYTLSIMKMTQWIGMGTALLLGTGIGILSLTNRRVPLTKKDLPTLMADGPNQ